MLFICYVEQNIVPLCSCCDICAAMCKCDKMLQCSVIVRIILTLNILCDKCSTDPIQIFAFVNIYTTMLSTSKTSSSTSANTVWKSLEEVTSYISSLLFKLAANMADYTN